MQKVDYEKVIEAAKPIMQKTGELLLSHFNTVLQRTYKHDGSYATQADIAAESFLIEQLKPLVPGAGFLAEESGKVAGNEYCWVIDPLDGTTNFAQGIPYFCSSVALTKNNKSVAGFIYQPVLKELFWAQEGVGAFLNGQKLTVSNIEKLDQAVVIFAYPYKDDPVYFDLVAQLNYKTYSGRCLGAAALDQAYCAAGRADAVIFTGLSWWDCAAGMLLISEAGGTVSEFNGESVGQDYRTFLGGNKLICDQVLNLIADR